jgi:hypothetical protein
MKSAFLTILLLSSLVPAMAQSSDDKGSDPQASQAPVNSSVPPAEGTSNSPAQPSPDAGAARNTSSDAVAANSSPSASPMTPWLPNAINGETGSLDFLSSSERSNWVSAGITVSSTYDDNALSTNNQKVGNVGYMVAPEISLQESRTRSSLGLSYSPGFTFNQRLSPNYDAEHNLNFNFSYRLTERLTARFHDGLVYGTTSFDKMTESQFALGENVLHRQNDAVITPLTNRLTNSAGVDLVDQIGETTMIGASGNFSRLHFLGTPSNSSVVLSDNQMWSADAFYSTRVSRRNSIGFTYTHQNLQTYDGIGQRVDSDSLLLFYTVYVKRGVSLSFLGGPNYTTVRTQSNTTKQLQWVPEAGTTLGWQGLRTSFQAGAIYSVTDGGGLTGAVRSYSVNAGLRQQFTRQWSANVGLNYSYDDPLGSSAGNTFYAVNGTAGIQRTIAQRVSIALMYGRDHQSFNNKLIVTNPLADHNRGWVSISYHFSHPLGI